MPCNITMKASVANRVKTTLIEGLKESGLKWFRPWKSGEANWPMNNASGRKYTGFNVFILNAEMWAHGYDHNEWLTFNAAKKAGGSVRKGETSTEVYFWNIAFVDKATGKFYKSLALAVAAGANADEVKKVFSLKAYRVFNIAQCDGIEPRNPETAEELNDHDPIETAEALISGMPNPPKIQTNIQDRAYYAPMSDLVSVPTLAQFNTPEAYYQPFFHELVHSTGHESRLSRKGVMTTEQFGKTKADYAFEELIAESGAMMLTGMAGLDVEKLEANTKAYINGWVKAVDEAPEQAVVSALTQSYKAVDFILGQG